MKKILLIALALVTLGTTVSTIQAAKKKTKEIKWDWDGTKSGNETIDNYLVCIDTTYRNIQQYKEQMEGYEMKFDTITIDGKYYAVAYMLNSKGEMVTRGEVNWQCAQAVIHGVNIVLDITNAQLSSATAVMALPELGLSALSFAKYVKGGAAVFTQGITEVKAIRGQWVSNSKKWKSLKNGAIEDPASLNYFEADALKKLNKCCYVKPILPEDENYQKLDERSVAKGKEQMKAESEAFVKQLAQLIVAPDDVKKQLDDVSDDELEKAMQG